MQMMMTLLLDVPVFVVAAAPAACADTVALPGDAEFGQLLTCYSTRRQFEQLARVT
jgi:hypothetical protein